MLAPSTVVWVSSKSKTPRLEGMRLSERVGGLLRGNALEAPPDGGWGWLVVLGGFTIHFNCLGLQYTFGILFKALLDDEELQRASGSTGGTAASTWAGSISACLMLLGSFPAGFLVRRCGMRATALSGAVFMFSGFNTWSFVCVRPGAWHTYVCVGPGLMMASGVSQLWMLYFTYGATTGVGFALLWSPSIVAVNRYFTSQRSLAVGISVSGSGVGTLVLSNVSGALIATTGWRSTLQLLAAATLLTNIAAALTFLPILPEACPRAPPPEVNKAKAQAGDPEIGADILARDDACVEPALSAAGCQRQASGRHRHPATTHSAITLPRECEGCQVRRLREMGRTAHAIRSASALESLCQACRQGHCALGDSPRLRGEIANRAPAQDVSVHVVDAGEGTVDGIGVAPDDGHQEQARTRSLSAKTTQSGDKLDAIAQGSRQDEAHSQQGQRTGACVMTVRELLAHPAAKPLGFFMFVYAGVLWVPYTFLVSYAQVCHACLGHAASAPCFEWSRKLTSSLYEEDTDSWCSGGRRAVATRGDCLFVSQLDLILSAMSCSVLGTRACMQRNAQSWHKIDGNLLGTGVKAGCSNGRELDVGASCHRTDGGISARHDPHAAQYVHFGTVCRGSRADTAATSAFGGCGSHLWLFRRLRGCPHRTYSC